MVHADVSPHMKPPLSLRSSERTAFRRGPRVLGALGLLVGLATSACDGSRPATADSGMTGSGGRAEGTGGAAPGSGGSGAGGAATGGTPAGTGGHSGSGGTSGTGGRGSGGSGGASGGGSGGVAASGGHGAGSGGTGSGGTGSGGTSPADAGTGDSGAAGCTYGGHTYAVGASFPATDGCNTCTCGAGGVVGCTKIGCIDSGASCALDTSYRFWNDGGLVAYTDDSKLTPPRTHTVSRDRFMNAPAPTCMRDVPCSSTTEVDIAKIQNALAHPDVVAALAMTTKPFYGTDPRPMDGQVFIFQRADGRGFTVGSGNAVPAGLRTLSDLLRTLQMQTLASTNCSMLR